MVHMGGSGYEDTLKKQVGRSIDQQAPPIGIHCVFESCSVW